MRFIKFRLSTPTRASKLRNLQWVARNSCAEMNDSCGRTTSKLYPESGRWGYCTCSNHMQMSSEMNMAHASFLSSATHNGALRCWASCCGRGQRWPAAKARPLRAPRGVAGYKESRRRRTLKRERKRAMKKSEANQNILQN